LHSGAIVSVIEKWRDRDFPVPFGKADPWPSA
jgi:hypothetical protein